MKATLSLKKTKPIMVMINGDLVSPAPLKAPPKANSIAISGCIEPRNQTKITVSLITSGSLIKNPDISLEKIATVRPIKVIEIIDNPVLLHPLLLASFGLSAPKN